MNYSQDGVKLTQQFEGCELIAYQDQGGTWTIGYGHTFGVYEGQTCTQAEADEWLYGDIQYVADAINRDLNPAILAKLAQGEFDALVDFGFNLGVHRLESSTLWRLLNAGDFDGAAAQFPRWDKCGGKEVAGLLRRRLAEQAEFKQGMQS